MNILERLRKGVSTSSAGQMRALAEELARQLPPDVTLALHGNLGVGKTTFVQGLARGFGITEAVTSPTFNIYTVHRSPGTRTLLHLDAYRLESSREVDDLLLDEFLVSPWCLAVEWPEKIVEWLPAQRQELVFAIDAEQRHSVRLVT
jgi:tRNA threonylcarbamoyladenosine biosynthesis protein TsaE